MAGVNGYTPFGQIGPQITKDDVATAIRNLVLAGDELAPGATLEVFTNFPSDQNKVSEGIYVATVYQLDRLKNSPGVTTGGWVYSVKDRIEMYLISEQDNPYIVNTLALFDYIIDQPVFTSNGYFLREMTKEQQYVKNSERYRIIFDLTRLQII
jgi:hypothetical protein